ncbi:MAG: hypothetical protein JWM56_1277 [Candidatus Peribacteria bacterium]|nr:hypothetical protein [Candidatus Peribacteria bacterium]
MRWPEKTQRKKWPVIFFCFEYTAALSRTFGIALFVLLTLFECKSWLETGHWFFIPVKILLADVSQVPVFTVLHSWYADPQSWYNMPGKWKGAHLAIAFFREQFPLSVFFLLVGKMVSVVLYWFIDRVFPDMKEAAPAFSQAGKKFVNIK